MRHPSLIASLLLTAALTAAGCGSKDLGNDPPPTDVKAAPRAAHPPSISGTPELGATLTASGGEWEGEELAFAYSWARCDASGAGCETIAGASTSDYTPVTADVLRTLVVRVIGSNSGGSVEARSAPTPRIGLPPCQAPLTAGPLSPTVLASHPGSVPWQSPTAALAADGAEARAADLGPGDLSDYLIVKGFGLAIPAEAAINGIEVRLTRRSSNGAGIQEAEIALLSDTDYSLELGAPSPWGAEAATTSFGGPAERWGREVWRASDLNSPDFGVRLLVRHEGPSGFDSALVDAVTMVVHYSLPSSVGPLTAGLVEEESAGEGIAWTTPSDAASEDGAAATAAVPFRTTTKRLVASRFGLALPSGKQPSGILVEVKRATTTGVDWATKETDRQLMLDGAPVGANRASSNGWTETLQWEPVGSATDAWGATLTADDLASESFGVRFGANYYAASGDATLEVDSFRITVFYDPEPRQVTASPSASHNQRFASPWTSPEKAATLDDVWSGAGAISGLDVTDDLRATGFGFSLPEGAVVHGIALGVKRRTANGGPCGDRRVRLLSGGQPLGEDQAADETWEWSLDPETYGGPGDLWGRGWTPAEINAADFGASFAAKYGSTSGNGQPQVDGVSLTVTYCAPR